MRLTLTITGIILSICSFSQRTYTLEDFYTYNPDLEQKVAEIFDGLNDTTRAGQMIIPAAGRLGKSQEHLNLLIEKKYIGGILLLNGTKAGFTTMVKDFNTINSSVKGLPFLYSADAEPSLIGYKIKNCAPVKKAGSMIDRNEVKYAANSISNDLIDIGINFNYAPVVDVSPNEAISYRAFGDNPDTAQVWSKMFIETTQSHGIVATAKHFPGHGYVVGDTHKKLVYIDGEMRELKNYPPLIEAGVLAVMIAHIAIKNNDTYNTNDLPSSVSPKVVTGLLKDELKFKGLIVTDAMNMGGVSSIPHCELLAAQAGCDLILMPIDEEKALFDIVGQMQKDKAFKSEVYSSVRKIIRMKVCLGLVD
ncbi:glycoside hydrolase family 3 N-terminal domain-containing protein [Crocinitomix catalasitica]|uniref:glycoside hydrolase family 3 N-terminal domain-containing protein n=1 Tax=Crocinitomix catalasitica TaxID=184607 RepID=UPI00068842F5|nr:glycoside hydrolase family 3 N-terminal domain-containing protein [Crocinitomix catalasitica]